MFGIFALHAAREDYVSGLSDLRALTARRGGNFGMIAEPATISDFASVSVDNSEYRDLRDCKAGDCNFKLPASTMAQFANEIDWSSPTAKRQVDSVVRSDLVRLTERYRAEGNAAMPRYDDAAIRRCRDTTIRRYDDRTIREEPRLGTRSTRCSRNRHFFGIVRGSCATTFDIIRRIDRREPAIPYIGRKRESRASGPRSH